RRPRGARSPRAWRRAPRRPSACPEANQRKRLSLPSFVPFVAGVSRRRGERSALHLVTGATGRKARRSLPDRCVVLALHGPLQRAHGPADGFEENVHRTSYLVSRRRRVGRPGPSGGQSCHHLLKDGGAEPSTGWAVAERRCPDGVEENGPEPGADGEQVLGTGRKLEVHVCLSGGLSGPSVSSGR